MAGNNDDGCGKKDSNEPREPWQFSGFCERRPELNLMDSFVAYPNPHGTKLVLSIQRIGESQCGTQKSCPILTIDNGLAPARSDGSF